MRYPCAWVSWHYTRMTMDPSSSASSRLAVLARQLTSADELKRNDTLAEETRPAPGGGRGTLTVLDNRTGKKYTVRCSAACMHVRLAHRRAADTQADSQPHPHTSQQLAAQRPVRSWRCRREARSTRRPSRQSRLVGMALACAPMTLGEHMPCKRSVSCLSCPIWHACSMLTWDIPFE